MGFKQVTVSTRKTNCVLQSPLENNIFYLVNSVYIHLLNNQNLMIRNIMKKVHWITLCDMKLTQGMSSSQCL